MWEIKIKEKERNPKRGFIKKEKALLLEVLFK